MTAAVLPSDPAGWNLDEVSPMSAVTSNEAVKGTQTGR
jgi:hypothetical protein